MSLRLLHDYVAYENVETYPVVSLIVDPTIKKIVTYVADGITDVAPGDEIIVSAHRVFSYETSDKRLFFVRREQIEAVIPKPQD